jgi:non-specific serine/threonine protein kinase
MRHMQWCLEFVERAARDPVGYEQPEWLDRMDLHHGNIRAALRWAIDNRCSDEALRISASCYQFWVQRGYCAEGRQWLERALALGGETTRQVRASALLGLGVTCCDQGDYERASVIEQALSAFRAEQDTAGVALALRALGRLTQFRGDSARATGLYEEALLLFRQLGDLVQETRTLLSLGLLAYDRGEFPRASTLLREGLTQAREQGIRYSAASALNNLALVSLETGELDQAIAFQQEALDEWQAVGYPTGIAHSFENLALVAIRRCEWHRAVVLFEAARVVRSQIGSPGRLIDREQNQRQLDELRTLLGEDAFAAACDAGRRISTVEAIAYALEHDSALPG